MAVPQPIVSERLDHDSRASGPPGAAGFVGLCSLGVTHLETGGQGRRGLAPLLRSPALPLRPRRLGVLSPRPVPWVRSPEYTPKAATARRLHRQRESVEMQDGARHVALHTPRLPPTTSSPWLAGARAPGLPPLRPPLAGCTPAVLSARQAECWPGLCQGLLFLSLSRGPRAHPGGPGTRARHTQGNPCGAWASRTRLCSPRMLVGLRVQRRLTLGPGGHLEPPAPLPPLLTPSSFFPFGFTGSLRLEGHSTVSPPGLRINICNMLHHDCPSGSRLPGTQGHVSGRPLSPPGGAGLATRCWVPGDSGRLWQACRKARGISGM